MRWWLVAACLALLALPPLARANPIQDENAKPGDAGWSFPAPPPHAIEGYATQMSVAPGDTLELHVSMSPTAAYRVVVYRLGWYGGLGAREMTCVPACDGAQQGLPQPLPTPDPATGEAAADWPVTDTVWIPPDWTSGYYVAQLEALTGPGAGSAASVYFVVRAPASQPSTILVQVPVNTWEAYDDWGGKSLYNFNSTGGVPATHVSFDRPIDWTALGAQSPLVWEYPLVRFLEREGYDVSYQTDVDTDADPASLLAHRLVMTAGHGEYWTRTMRDAFDAARDHGVNLAFMGSNTGYWQVRYEDGGRTLVGYKSQADPVSDPAAKTDLFRVVGDPECELEGVMHMGSLGMTDYAVNPAALGDPWFASTGFTATSTLPLIVGREWDQIPSWLPPGCSKPGLVVLFHHEGPPGNADAVRYTAPSGARVFATGTLQFAWGLDAWGASAAGYVGPDPRLQQFMRNALADLTQPPVPPPAPPAPAAASTAATARPRPRVRRHAPHRRRGRVRPRRSRV